MKHQFSLVQRFSIPGDTTSEKKWYASAKSNGVANITEVCNLIAARSTVSSADVKAVLDNLNYAIDFYLKSGHIIQLGELGNFRLTLRSEGAMTKKEFTQSMLRGVKLIFFPGANLRETCLTTQFTLFGEKKKDQNEDTGADTGMDNGVEAGNPEDL